MEFKGTSGKWKRVKLEKTSFYPERNEIHYGSIGECVAEFVHNDYDALLISKAPEILKELVNEVEILKAMGLGDTERCKRKERLIKEATEL